MIATARVCDETSQRRSRPLVSIVVPAYNAEKYLRESLDSILAQTYPNVEVLVMDDYSTDGTPAILASYGQRIRVIRQPKNRGIYGNANDGIAASQGEYIAVYHSDDVYLPEMVEREVEFLEKYPEGGRGLFEYDLYRSHQRGVRATGTAARVERKSRAGLFAGAQCSARLHQSLSDVPDGDGAGHRSSGLSGSIATRCFGTPPTWRCGCALPKSIRSGYWRSG